MDGFNLEPKEGVKAQFNSAWLQMRRLDALQRQVQEAEKNFTAFSNEHGVYNFELIFTSNNGLLQEVWPKLTATEQAEGLAMREGIQVFINSQPIFQQIRQPRSPRKTMVKTGLENINVLRNWLFKYGLAISLFLDTHGLTTPNREEDDGL